MTRKYRSTREGRRVVRFIVRDIRLTLAHPEDYRNAAEHAADVDALRRSLRATLASEVA